MAAWFDTIISPLKAASESAQKIIEIRDTVKLGEATVRLYAQIMTAYEAAFAIKEREATLSEENSQLKKRVAELEALGARKDRYELKKLPPGVVVYALKANAEPPEEFHYACQTCFEQNKISALQSRGVRNGLETLVCKGCGAEVKTGHFKPPSPAPLRSSWVNSRR